MYEIAICDDDGAFAGELSAMLSDMFRERGLECRVRVYADPALMLSALESGQRCELLFQDILFGEEKGIRFARLLRERGWDLDLVFVTSSEKYAVAGYDVQPLHYLLKPLQRRQLAAVLERFLARRAPDILSLTAPQGTVRLPAADVLYFEVYNHIVRLRRQNGDDHSWRGSLQELESELPPGRFARVHRSYLVNLEHVVMIERDRLKLSSGDTVPLGRADYANIQMALAAFDRRRRPSG